MTKEEFRAKVRRREKDLFELCSSLIRIPSENPPGDTTRLASFIKGYLEERGISTETHEPRTGMPNVVGRLGAGTPNLVLSGHMDTFPAGENWALPPFSGELREGRIHGRGAGDMKGGIAVALFLTSLIKELKVGLRGSLTLAFVSDEETGGKWGTEWLLKNVKAVRGDACLIGESSGTGLIGVGEKGVLWLRLKAAGVSGHAAYAQGESAISKVIAAHARIAGLHGKRGKPPAEIGRMIRRQRRVVEGLWGRGTGRLAGVVTVNVGTLRGGGQVNLIPERCEAEIDFRVPPGMTASGIEKEVRRRVGQLRLKGLEIEVTNRCDPYVTSPRQKLIDLLVANSSDVFGAAALPVVRLGMTDGRLFRKEGIPTAIYGPQVHNMGAPNEHIRADELAQAASVHAGVILDYLGGDSRDG
jgi:succinyl-diaminopimelate desuccinylase